MKKGLFFILALALTCQNIQTAQINRVIFASDNNPTYLEFWPLVSKAWCRISNNTVRPTLAFIGTRDENNPIDETYGDVVYIDPVEGLNTGYQAQVIRVLIPALFPTDFCLLSDIDMFPLQLKYFTKPIRKIPDHKFIVYRNAAYGPNPNAFPMCYNAALGSTFKEIFQVESFDDMRALMSHWHTLGMGWFTDERMLYECLTRWQRYSQDCVKLNHNVGPRIDRGDNMKFNASHLRNQRYIDAHCSRPYKQYKHVIDQMLSIAKLN
ncbi:MAG: hypothetical protein HOH13_05910 [Crocinitomicaceae bacterium]|jgi:hypothetical protein|nr:hypothetical protein [bacterium]MBT5015700.1 hypothetical protein [bacterium]MBT5974656.1 hypothetical protein [Flavobacteriaceae bacterium]MBT6029821.1 hypothetical protein [Crocinitomicaceae bacterium]